MPKKYVNADIIKAYIELLKEKYPKFKTLVKDDSYKRIKDGNNIDNVLKNEEECYFIMHISNDYDKVTKENHYILIKRYESQFKNERIYKIWDSFQFWRNVEPETNKKV